jgi:hypothetical protein
MNLTIAALNTLGFKEVPNRPQRTFKRRNDNVILYEYLEPIWLVQLDGTVGEFMNLMRVMTKEDLEIAINGRNSI